MALPIDQIILNNLINQLANVSTGQTASATNPQNNQTAIANILADLNPRLPDVLFNNNVTATVSNTTPSLANILANNANAINTANSTNQLNVLIPQVTSETPAVQVIVTTNQAQLQQGQQVQIQMPDAAAFTRVSANNIVANVNIVVPPSQNTEAQTASARINIIVPPISTINSNFDTNNQFIRQDINNPNTLLGKNFSAYFIQTPDEGVTTKLPSQLTQPINQPQEIAGLHIRINNLTLPNSSQVAPSATQSNFTGTVIFAADNETIINTNIGTLRLPINLQVPVGTNIEFDIAAIDLKNLKNMPEVNINNADVLKQYLNSDNSAIKQLLSALQMNNAVTGNNQAPAAQLPNTTDKYIMARALWFLGNVSGTSPEKWLGEEGRNNLRKANDGNMLLNRVDGLFKTLRSFFTTGQEQATTQTWNNFVIPFMDSDNELNFVNFYTERDANSDSEDSNNKATRFVVELNNSYYGEVQIDGLLSKHPNSKTLDVFFRYTGNISEEDKNNIRDVFQNSLEQSNLKGNLIFQQTEIEDIPRPYASGQVLEAISPTGYII